MKTIEITVSPLGETKLQTKGFSGSECIAASRDFETQLGIKDSEVQTSEFFEQTGIVQQGSCQKQEQ